jgi:hypothetical protein
MNKTIQINVYLNDARLSIWSKQEQVLKDKTKVYLLKEIDVLNPVKVIDSTTTNAITPVPDEVIVIPEPTSVQ